ncbi:MAG: formate dehydrogenase subunit delta [Alphaproteobacteria bacterium]|nr:formate dehydrogenase subunit delta [Alphaproteobacteria bacterium]
METSDIVRMANQIAAFFKSYGPEEGTKEIAAHINNFWEPRMRQHFFSYLAQGGKSLDPMILASVPLIRKAADHNAHQGALPKHGEES